MSLGNSEFTQERRDLPQAEGVGASVHEGCRQVEREMETRVPRAEIFESGGGGVIPQKQPEKQAVLNLPVRGTG